MSESVNFMLPERFDYSFHRQFNEGCNDYIANANLNEIILDFSRVGYLDSSALGMLVMVQKKASSAAKKIKIKGAKGATAEILRMANIQKMIEFV
ncbi:MAG: STAS domain-containing protein [Cellvibrio sp.]|jgi:anti-anti-sigma factor|nr:STAS domain-containing protein [Cellvibrio sp.]